MKRILFTIYFASLFCFSSAMSAIPNTEGLFRNPNNPDLTGNFVETKVLFEEQGNETGTKVERFKGGKAGLLKRYLRFIFSVDKDKRIRTVQIEYDGKKMRDSEISQVTYFPNLLSKLKKDSNLSRVLFYSQIFMFALNDSRPISNFFKRSNSDYQLNRELLNMEKVSLFKRYKRYLSAIKKNKDLRSSLNSPLQSSDDEKKMKIKEVLSSRTYRENEKVKLIREGGKFYWSLDLMRIKALFENKNHRIKSLFLETKIGNISYEFGEFISLNGLHELPKYIHFNVSDEKKYKITFLSFKNFLSKSKKRTIRQRYKNWKKRWKLSREKVVNRDLMTTTDFDIISPSTIKKKTFIF